MPNPDAPTNTTPYSEEELEYFKNLLLEKRKETTDEIEVLKESLNNMVEADDDETSSIAHHQGDISSDYEEEETKYTLIERSKKYIEQIDAALERITNRTYGICQATGKKIEKERLKAVPHTRYSIEAKNRGSAE